MPDSTFKLYSTLQDKMHAAASERVDVREHSAGLTILTTGSCSVPCARMGINKALTTSKGNKYRLIYTYQYQTAMTKKKSNVRTRNIRIMDLTHELALPVIQYDEPFSLSSVYFQPIPKLLADNGVFGIRPGTINSRPGNKILERGAYLAAQLQRPRVAPSV
ncbi:hypothetical protein AG1IA_04637 [Rhizoctonia solani AG-1 IA]|uniref:Uncharacterized protein n=1 Tax=Thanatephorus cucumeris (strain AG1-IA) TaxID=983506 RepID=L8WWZ0_THACA|nr:hypothetical protein AG1IA_04637 [Rhizoctonia solani AG-1 IA]